MLVYHILEPFLHSILWSILTGALLFPFKTHITLISRHYLSELDKNSHLLVYGLILLLPLKIFDKLIELIPSFCITKWKQLIIILIFLPSIEFLQSGIVYRWIITIGYDYFIQFNKSILFFHSSWIVLFIFIYFFAVFTIYNNSLIIKSILKKISLFIWWILFIYFSQYLSINYQFIAIHLLAICISIGFIVDKNVNGKLIFEIKNNTCFDFLPINIRS